MFHFHHASDALGGSATVKAAPTDCPNRLVGVRSFGTNPGQLRMFTYTPASLAENSALVVVLHGCGQTAAEYAHGAGWLTLADRYGFALLMPEQQRSNNSTGCFNWFRREDTHRGSGEPASIRQMIEAVERDTKIDPRRVFVTGLSAGGAMTSVMLACYPEIVSAGAIIAGLPYGAACNVQEAFQSMYQSPSRLGTEWGDLVRSAAPQHRGSWPRVSIWHGDADKTVVPLNAREIAKQWIDVHGLSSTPSAETTAEGYPLQVWTSDSEEQIIEYYSITNMAHGTPLSTGDADVECGTAGPLFLEAGISSSFHIARFFGLTCDSTRAAASQSRRLSKDVIAHRQPLADSRACDGRGSLESKPKHIEPRSPVDTGAVILTALTSAGPVRRG